MEVVLQGALNHHGFVRDYGDLRALKEYLDAEFDHRLLNDVLGALAPTAENLAWTLYIWCRAQWPEVIAVRVSETSKKWAEFRRERES